jgi:hypothetical protein
MINIMACSPTLWAHEHLPVSVEIVLHDVVLGALEGVELEARAQLPEIWVVFLIIGLFSNIVKKVIPIMFPILFDIL